MKNDVRTALDAATTFTRTTALWIATLPADARDSAYNIARAKLRETIIAEIGESELVNEVVRSQMAEVRELVDKIDASGGAVAGRA